MLKLLLVARDENPLSGLASSFMGHDDVELYRVESGEKALEIASDTEIDLAVTDEHLGDMSGLEFARRLIFVNPMINCASVSSLSSEKFHEVSEGLGLMAQLPIQPGKKDAEKLLQDLRYIKSRMGGA